MTPGAWGSAIPELLLATFWLLVPGLVIVLALGLARRLFAVLVAPALSVGVLGAFAVVLGAVGVPWHPAAVLVTILLTGIVIMAFRAGLRRRTPDLRWLPRPDVASRPTSSAPASRRLIVIGVILGGLLAAAPIASGLAPDLLRLGWDPVFHLSATRFAVETGNASPFVIQQVMTPGRPDASSFYPAAWHAIAALSSVDSVITGTNALILVVSGAVWPMGLAALACAVAPQRPVAAAIAPVAGAGLFAFPTFLIGWGWPNALSIAVIPATLALLVAALRAIGHGSGGRLRDGVTPALLSVVGLTGIGLAHPNGAMTFGIMATPAVVATAFGQARSPVQGAQRGGEIVRARGLAWIGAAGVWCAALWTLLVASGARISDTSQQGTSGFLTGVWLAATGAITSTAGGAVLVLLLGLGALVVLGERRARWLVAALVLLVLLAGLAEADSPLKWLTRTWFMDPSRLRAPVVILVAIIVPLGIAAVSERLSTYATQVMSRPRHGRSRHRLAPGTLVAAGLTVVLVAASGGLWAGERREFFSSWTLDVAEPGTEFNLASVSEMAMIKRVADEITPGALVLGSPFTGATLLYAVDGIPVVFTNFGGRWTEDAQFLALHFSELHQNPAVCEAVRRLGVKYYYTDRTVYHPAHPLHQAFVGLTAEPPQPGFELVDSGDSASLYRITACD